MSADWERVQEIFLAASELEGVARDTWLEEACGADAALRDDVESLLAASADGESLISAAVQGAFELAAEESGSSKARQRIGPYEIGNKLGEGGLSTVFLAQRADDEFNMRVAIKVVKRGMDTADILRRLRQERQILAHLDHPNVAKIFDGGTTDDGLPYFVMEHIEGEPIDEYCDRRELSISERLELFRTACSAVHAAHQSLVIHRDIKPSNLLVTADGIPKLLDFGIAKLIDAEPQLHTLAQTAPGMVLMTPEFASPEQVTGQPLTTATDVYSLGVMLYRLLTGHRPYRFASGRPAEVERILLRSKPERPSEVVGRTIEELTPTGGTVTLTPETVARPREGTPEKLRRRLAGDLDKIVLMAIRKEPQRRYASVEQLAEDIERSLQSLPVLAQKDTIRYRTGKFVRRNRGSVAAGVLILLALLGGIVTTSWQARVAVAERSRAEQHLAEARLQSARAERVSDFLTGLFEISDPGEARGNQVTAREILDRGAERIRQELSEEPDLRAELMITMGRVYRNLGLYGPAGELLAEVQAERRRTLGEAHPEVARNLTRVAEIEFEKGQWDTAEDLLRRALESQRQQLGDEHVDVATTL
ncbi:MAG: serine/threonine-protein kinase, partial [Acidobacteriota bacterium]